MTGGTEKKICVITGGGSGMGFATAKEMGKDYRLILVGRNEGKLELAADALRKTGMDVESFACDVADLESTAKLAAHAKARGTVAAVIHAAGMSPHMGDADKIMEANAFGTINVNNAFFPIMESGSCIIDVASMSGYLTPRFIMPERCYPLSRTDPEKFAKRMMQRVRLFPGKLRSSVAYGISKHFVTWYAKTDAARFGKNGVRVLSVSPGNFDTPMGALEKEEASTYTDCCAIKRPGNVDEIGALLAMCADPRMGYLTGVDILCDGGCVASGCKPRQRK